MTRYGEQRRRRCVEGGRDACVAWRNIFVYRSLAVPLRLEVSGGDLGLRRRRAVQHGLPSGGLRPPIAAAGGGAASALRAAPVCPASCCRGNAARGAPCARHASRRTSVSTSRRRRGPPCRRWAACPASPALGARGCASGAGRNGRRGHPGALDVRRGGAAGGRAHRWGPGWGGCWLAVCTGARVPVRAENAAKDEADADRRNHNANQGLVLACELRARARRRAHTHAQLVFGGRQGGAWSTGPRGRGNSNSVSGPQPWHAAAGATHARARSACMLRRGALTRLGTGSPSSEPGVTASVPFTNAAA